MENFDKEEIEKMRSLLLVLEHENSKMYHELRDFKLKLDDLQQKVNLNNIPAEKPLLAEENTVISEKLVEIIPVSPIKPEEKIVVVQKVVAETIQKPVQKTIPKQKSKSDWEQFIGENLINKIGILITVIGVAIGAKYAIDHELINPSTRITLAYLVGITLMLFAIKLKPKYLDFSAVLLSGSMAIFYFVTFISYSFYHFFSVEMTFVLMFVFTGFTVFSAIKYDRPIIAHLGLVGAYAVPFLLSDGSGRIGFFFSYILLVNVGILIISFLRNWKSLYFVSFGFTYLIYLFWYAISFKSHLHFEFAFLFLCLFFITFYVTSLAYKVLKKEQFVFEDILLMLGNSFLFFGLGYNLIANYGDYSMIVQNGRNILSKENTLEDFLGLFCIFNAILHFIVSIILFKNKLVDRKVFFLTAALVLFFITITIPIQFDGNVVVITWIFEATMLFCLGRFKKIALFETMSYPIIVLSFLSLIYFWYLNYVTPSFYFQEPMEVTAFIFNSKFLTSFCFLICISFVYFLNTKKVHLENYIINLNLLNTFKVIIFLIFILSTYLTFFLEINLFWYFEKIDIYYIHNNLRNDFGILNSLSIISKLAYSLGFIGIFLFFRKKKENMVEFTIFSLLISSGLILAFLLIGLYQLNFLQLKYLFSEKDVFYIGKGLVFIRFAMYVLFGCYLFVYTKFWKNAYNDKISKIYLDYLLHFVLVWVLSAELVNWMHLFDSNQAYKLGLSIFWGVYSLGLVSLGIWKKKSYLRIGAISLFGVTLIKLFLYDLKDMTTITKTVVFIALGILLLIISFLYNKYKSVLFEETNLPENEK